MSQFSWHETLHLFFYSIHVSIDLDTANIDHPKLSNQMKQLSEYASVYNDRLLCNHLALNKTKHTKVAFFLLTDVIGLFCNTAAWRGTVHTYVGCCDRLQPISTTAIRHLAILSE